MSSSARRQALFRSRAPACFMHPVYRTPEQGTGGLSHNTTPRVTALIYAWGGVTSFRPGVLFYQLGIVSGAQVLVLLCHHVNILAYLGGVSYLIRSVAVIRGRFDFFILISCNLSYKMYVAIDSIWSFLVPHINSIGVLHASSTTSMRHLQPSAPGLTWPRRRQV